ncbi:MAG: Rrf2 family transcriptional regulator [Phycisphaerae bacterium]|nr:Rrf2 family transcriptional regulator [Phycisphaerae bacterium]MDD5380074.1 Rrf2 family transcriptional regulator [Phycisphaerae bacterium]
MDVLRRNTDYALRIMVSLAKRFNGEFISARQLAEDGHFSYQLGCKILQRLHKAGLVKSDMGPKGGFALNKEPSAISLMEIINVLQGGLRLNRCLFGGKGCEFEAECEINTKLTCLQLYIEGYLSGITLTEILRSRTKTKVA